tara:strand:+ start:855 stop:1184 length:330 start_codon:yes stop_codon:yes gene_type:complete
MITLISLVASLALNVFLLLYIRSLLTRLILISDEVNEMKKMLQHYFNHLESVYEMETFYGDETLHGMLQHSKEIGIEIENFVDNFLIIGEDTDEDSTDDTEHTEKKEEE